MDCLQALKELLTFDPQQITIVINLAIAALIATLLVEISRMIFSEERVYMHPLYVLLALVIANAFAIPVFMEIQQMFPKLSSFHIITRNGPFLAFVILLVDLVIVNSIRYVYYRFVNNVDDLDELV